jgi:hypothetical protein
MPACADGERQLPFTGEQDTLPDVGDACAPEYRGRAAVNHEVENPPRSVVIVVSREQQLPA